MHSQLKLPLEDRHVRPSSPPPLSGRLRQPAHSNERRQPAREIHPQPHIRRLHRPPQHRHPIDLPLSNADLRMDRDIHPLVPLGCGLFIRLFRRRASGFV